MYKHWMEWDNEIDDGYRILDPDGFRFGAPTFVTKEEFLRAKAACTLVGTDDVSWTKFMWPKSMIDEAYQGLIKKLRDSEG